MTSSYSRFFNVFLILGENTYFTYSVLSVCKTTCSPNTFNVLRIFQKHCTSIKRNRTKTGPIILFLF